MSSNLSGLVAVDLGDVGEQVTHTAGVAPLVVVPADQLDEVGIERDAGLGVEDGGVGVAVQVRGDDFVFGVGEDACIYVNTKSLTGMWGSDCAYPCTLPRRPPSWSS